MTAFETPAHTRLRPPAVPLINVDPYFSVWSPDEHINFASTCHWTGKNMPVSGVLYIDGVPYQFIGFNRKSPHKMKQFYLDVTAMETIAKFRCDALELTVNFFTPLLMDDFSVMSRPVTYLDLSWKSLDGKKHSVEAEIAVSEAFCLDHIGQSPVVTETVALEGMTAIRMGNSVQNVLNRSGDDLRIDWGYVYLAAVDEKAKTDVHNIHYSRGTEIIVRSEMAANKTQQFLFAYDDIRSIEYFGDALTSYWNKDGMTITEAMTAAVKEYKALKKRAQKFSDRLEADAVECGGRKYADLLLLAYRQVIGAHKLVVDKNGEVLFISKECFSNGCAATVDVTYPSIPLFLRYCPELVKGMLRPVYRYATSDAWDHDFAPHDVGQYPLLNGQVYGLVRETGKIRDEMQMPVEESGNMLICEANIALATKDASFAAGHIDLLEQWCKYLITYGNDPENQLCTDDFAGHQAHNCNLSVKAVMGIEAMALLLKMLNRQKDADRYFRTARKMAKSWMSRALNEDGSSRLAFDSPDTFSMKYNMVWDKIWGTGLFPKTFLRKEIRENLKKNNEFGMPLDCRAEYTKSDWLVWTATMADGKKTFESFIAPLWTAYNESPSRVPMTDWFDTVSSREISFQHRTVQGGLYIKLLDATGALKLDG